MRGVLSAAWGGRQVLLSCFRQQEQDGEQAACRDPRKPKKRDLTAETIGEIAGKRRADRRTDPDRRPDDPLREIELAGAARDIGDHQRHHDAERRRRDAVEQLHRDEQIRVGHDREEQSARDQRCESGEQKQPPAPHLRPDAQPTAISVATTTCGTTMQAAISTVAHSLDRVVTTLPIRGSIEAFAR